MIARPVSAIKRNKAMAPKIQQAKVSLTIILSLILTT